MVIVGWLRDLNYCVMIGRPVFICDVDLAYISICVAECRPCLDQLWIYSLYKSPTKKKVVDAIATTLIYFRRGLPTQFMIDFFVCSKKGGTAGAW